MCRFAFSVCLLAFIGGSLPGQDNVTVVDAQLAAPQRFVQEKPTAGRWAGLAEMKRTAGWTQQAFGDFTRSAQVASAREKTLLQELLCWHMLPAVGRIGNPSYNRFCQELTRLKDGDSTWRFVFDLYRIHLEQDRAALLRAVNQVPAQLPEQFPTALAEKAHFDLLLDLNWPRVRAGIEVISSRDYSPLHALRDLDRGLTREAGFLSAAGRKEDAARIVAVRDRLRQAYLQSSRHTVERLFALNLLGRTRERDALLKQARAIAYLNNPTTLRQTFDRMDDDQTWSLVIEPLLSSEVALVETPPDLAGRMRPGAETTVQMNVQARKKTEHADDVSYEGEVRVELGSLRISCERLTAAVKTAAAQLTGTDKVTVHGMPTAPGGISADGFTYVAGTGEFTFTGDVRLVRADTTLKLRQCTVTRQGEVHSQRNLLDDFQCAETVAGKLELLPKIVKVYADEELPDEVRFLLALNLLRPNLTWHARYLPYVPREAEVEMRKKPAEAREAETKPGEAKGAGAPFLDDPWREAMGGEPWMYQDIPHAVKDKVRDDLAKWNTMLNSINAAQEHIYALPEKAEYFWRLRDPNHADVPRILKLLQLRELRVDGDLRNKAQRWAAELRRNNTVVTMDIPGASAAGRPVRLLMDVRGGEKVSFKLYRIQRPEDLLWAANRVGTDFVYRDHGLHETRKMLEAMPKQGEPKAPKDVLKEEERSADKVPPPDFQREDLVHQWNVAIADLRGHEFDRWNLGNRYYDRYDQENADSWYFDDASEKLNARLHKDYMPEERRLSSWQCNRIVEVPGKALDKTGAYVLLAECNGQTAHVPLLVDPLSVTLGRCRDGVFVLAGENDGTKAVAGARVFARGMHGQSKTDKEGAAFAHVFAAGDRPIVLHHEGRFAIGGFGQAFEGIYKSFRDRDRHYYYGWGAMPKVPDRSDSAALLYEDGHVVAAYTDRPTYRPGQEVHFKLIVRKLVQSADAEKPAEIFRAEDFDLTKKLTLPKLGQELAYAVLDAKGIEVAQGTLKLNDFGTAVDTIQLNSETGRGNYSLRVRINGTNRIVPEVFAVKDYRRPNFEIDLKGVPANLTKLEEISMQVSGQYYFGKPVAEGKVQVRLIRADRYAPLAEVEGALDALGKTDLKLELPANLAGGKYFLLCSVTDDSGRTVSKSVAALVDQPAFVNPTAGLAALPRFLAVGKEFQVSTAAAEVWADSEDDCVRFGTVKGQARIKLSSCGWHRLTADAESVDLFVYGGDDHPLSFERPEEGRKWVNLTDFHHEEFGGRGAYREEEKRHELLALFDRQHVEVGGKLRVLVYVPFKKARLLFTMEGRTVLDYFTTWTHGVPEFFWTKPEPEFYHVIEIPIKERLLPNFYLQGRIVAGQELFVEELREVLEAQSKRLQEEDEGLDPRWCRIDVLDPNRKAGSDPLKVAVEPDKTEYRPGDEVKVRLKVTDLQGRPRAAEVSLGAVDESVYSFGEDGTASLSGFFAAPREQRRFLPKAWRSSMGNKWHPEQLQKMEQLSKSLEDLQRKVGQAKAGQPKEGQPKNAEATGQFLRDRELPLPLLGEMPVGQIPLGRMRVDFRETAAWQPQLRTGPDGIVQTSFRLPDSLTRYRLTALALTQQTEIGVGRAHVKASLPLAVQVMLPRFAVEQDRLLAVGLIHNNTARERTCQLKWEVQGARLTDPDPLPLEWRSEAAGTGKIAFSKITIPANGTARVGVWLSMDQVGTATVVLHVAEGKDADAETRTFPVHPMGRQREVVANGKLEPFSREKADEALLGRFTRQARIQLPAGFYAQDLHLNIACADLAQSLDGLEYLVDYPFGCIEQTMSRFLPAVMVKHASQRTPINLPPDVAAKLPDILAKGLARVATHQLDDGSWGWFARADQDNDLWTVYVAYGLARCKSTGTAVDEKVLKRGCQYLQQRLQAGKMNETLSARAWYVLALAGHADRNGLAKSAREALDKKHEVVARCNMALACRSAGLNELGEKLWGSLLGWRPEETDQIALHLTAQIAFGARWEDCRHSAFKLLEQRNGNRWQHTRATSWAIEALAEMLRYMPERSPVRHVQVWVNGKSVMNVTDPAELRMLVYHLRLTGAQLEKKEALDIRLAVDSDDHPIHYSFSATGTQRMDKLEPSGTRITMLRELENLDGTPLRGPVKVGQVFRVRLRLNLEQGEGHVMIMDRRFAGCEFADERIEGDDAKTAAHVEFRDDRLCVFHTALSAGRHDLVYYLRAETPGISHGLPGCVYPMYNETIRGETGSFRLEIK